MFRAPLCPSSGARENYTSGCCLLYLVLGFQVVGMVCSCGSPQTGHTTRNYTPYRQLENWVPNTTDSNHLYNSLELLMMGIMVPKTCWASNKICNKNPSVASSWHLFPHIIDDARSKPHQIHHDSVSYEQQIHQKMTQKSQLNLKMKIMKLIKSWLECQTEVFKIICPQVPFSF
jgi:hypothetical protein